MIKSEKRIWWGLDCREVRLIKDPENQIQFHQIRPAPWSPSSPTSNQIEYFQFSKKECLVGRYEYTQPSIICVCFYVFLLHFQSRPELWALVLNYYFCHQCQVFRAAVCGLLLLINWAFMKILAAIPKTEWRKHNIIFLPILTKLFCT